MVVEVLDDSGLGVCVEMNKVVYRVLPFCLVALGSMGDVKRLEQESTVRLRT